LHARVLRSDVRTVAFIALGLGSVLATAGSSTAAHPTVFRVDHVAGRLLRYVVRVSDGLNVNLRLVAVGAAAPYFYHGRLGRYAGRLRALAASARRRKRGLWRACPHTVYDPYSRIQTRR
jgi:Staphylococcal nuclease homologue